MKLRCAWSICCCSGRLSEIQRRTKRAANERHRLANPLDHARLHGAVSPNAR
jgi:hypothetical protein